MQDTRRFGALLLFAIGASAGCSSDTGSSAGSGGAGGSGHVNVCREGQVLCDGAIARVCDGRGGYLTGATDCGAGSQVCANGIGCALCIPGEESCNGASARRCDSDGSGFTEFSCDSVQGMRCESNRCVGACAPRELGESYLGCDYYPTVTLNSVWSGFHFAVAVANAGADAAAVTVTRAGDTIEQRMVNAGELAVIELPWVPELKGGDQDACVQPPDPGVTRRVANGAYRLRTDRPVTVYQLSPLEYTLAAGAQGCPRRADCAYPKPKDANDPNDPANIIRAQFAKEGCLSFTNDASLLLPATALTRAYTTLAWPSQSNTAAFLAITATSDHTQVTLSGRGRFASGAGIDEAGQGTVELDRGDVLEVVSQHQADAGEFDAAGDPSGTRIVASAPISVIAGHSCANVPEATTLACDHLEESMLPSETLGTDYLVTYPAARASRSPALVRIVATQEATRVSFPDGAPARISPASCGSSCVVNPSDPPLELRNVDRDFRVTADKPILVGEYMLGQGAVESGSGDPSLSIAVPTEQFRRDYIFIASKTYDVSFVNVTAKANSRVSIDGEVIASSEFEPIGSSGYSVARHELGAGEVHHAEASEPFGIVVYGYGTYTSYMYPGGLDLKRIAPAVVR